MRAGRRRAFVTRGDDDRHAGASGRACRGRRHGCGEAAAVSTACRQQRDTRRRRRRRTRRAARRSRPCRHPDASGHRLGVGRGVIAQTRSSAPGGIARCPGRRRAEPEDVRMTARDRVSRVDDERRRAPHQVVVDDAVVGEDRDAVGLRRAPRQSAAPTCRSTPPCQRSAARARDVRIGVPHARALLRAARVITSSAGDSRMSSMSRL